MEQRAIRALIAGALLTASCSPPGPGPVFVPLPVAGITPSQWLANDSTTPRPERVTGPRIKAMAMPPFPAAERNRGFKLQVVFEVDSLGRATKIHYTPTNDLDFDRKIREMLRAFTFEPGRAADGRPVGGVTFYSLQFPR